MFFPLSDDDRALVKPAIVTWALLGLNLAAFYVQWNHEAFTFGFSAVPLEITTGNDLVGPKTVDIGAQQSVQIVHAPGPTPIYLTLITSMFLHGGLAHLGSNMLFLWIFGDNVEHRFGHLPFLAFYLISGLAGSIAHIALDPQSMVPMLGASGAISGVLGAYLILFPYNRVNVIVLFYIVSIPAMVVIGLWAASQLVQGYGSLGGSGVGGVAYAAHIGGFAAGVAIALALRTKWRNEPASAFAAIYHDQPQAKRWW